MIFHDENPFEPKAVGGRRRKPGTLSDEALDLLRELSMIGGKHGRCVWHEIIGEEPSPISVKEAGGIIDDYKHHADQQRQMPNPSQMRAKPTGEPG